MRGWSEKLPCRSSEARGGLFKCKESSFHYYRGAVKLVQACSIAGKVGQCSFNHCRGPVKLVEACLSVRKNGK